MRYNGDDNNKIKKKKPHIERYCETTRRFKKELNEQFQSTTAPRGGTKKRDAR